MSDRAAVGDERTVINCVDALSPVPRSTHPDAELLLGIRERARAYCAEILNARVKVSDEPR